jgi:SAM-dependent methyltransferase
LVRESRWLFQKLNQFAVLSEQDLKRLTTLVNDWLNTLYGALLAANSAAECLELLRPQSTTLVRELAALLTASAQPNVRIRSEEYSANTQLEILRLQAATIEQPVLDVGCGRDAELVKWLRSKNVTAVGFDLFDSETNGCLVADWFEFPFEPDRFGTITAHLSFSLHFLHQHLRPDSEARRYALQYMAILRSLRRGGCFAYAPGLPFIEGLLPSDQYAIRRFAIDSLPVDEQAMEVFAKNLGESPIYTCHVERK